MIKLYYKKLGTVDQIDIKTFLSLKFINWYVGNEF